jgi:hypothetical protein
MNHDGALDLTAHSLQQLSRTSEEQLSIEQQSSRAAESSRAGEQQSSRAAEQQSSTSENGGT